MTSLTKNQRRRKNIKHKKEIEKLIADNPGAVFLQKETPLRQASSKTTNQKQRKERRALRKADETMLSVAKFRRIRDLHVRLVRKHTRASQWLARDIYVNTQLICQLTDDVEPFSSAEPSNDIKLMGSIETLHATVEKRCVVLIKRNHSKETASGFNKMLGSTQIAQDQATKVLIKSHLPRVLASLVMQYLGNRTNFSSAEAILGRHMHCARRMKRNTQRDYNLDGGHAVDD